MERILTYTLLILVAIIAATSCSPRIVTVAVHDTTTVTRSATPSSPPLFRSSPSSSPRPTRHPPSRPPLPHPRPPSPPATSATPSRTGAPPSPSLPRFPKNRKLSRSPRKFPFPWKSPSLTSRNGHGTSSSGQSSSPSSSSPQSGCGSECSVSIIPRLGEIRGGFILTVVAEHHWPRNRSDNHQPHL